MISVRSIRKSVLGICGIGRWFKKWRSEERPSECGMDVYSDVTSMVAMMMSLSWGRGIELRRSRKLYVSFIYEGRA